MIVLRLENINGEGMYSCGAAHFMQERGFHVRPENDEKLWKNLQIYSQSTDKEDCEQEMWNFRFGFSDCNQLKMWVYRKYWLQELEKVGMIVAQYECEDWNVLVGNSQALFKNEINKTVSSITDYFKEK